MFFGFASRRLAPDRLIRWIRHVRTAYAREGSQFVNVCVRRAHNMFHRDFSHGESVCDKRPVTAPRYRFSAHQRARLDFRKLNRTRKSSLEFGSLHVIGEAAKTCIVPADVFGI